MFHGNLSVHWRKSCVSVCSVAVTASVPSSRDALVFDEDLLKAAVAGMLVEAALEVVRYSTGVRYVQT
jgi:hypothetical protein